MSIGDLTIAMIDPVRLTFASFGQTAPADEGRRTGPGLYLGASLFVLAGLLITIVFNFFTLFCGVTFTFLGKDKAEFRFFSFFGRVPVVAVALPVLFGYAIWHQGSLNGLVETALPFFGVWALGAACLVLVALLSRLGRA